VTVKPLHTVYLLKQKWNQRSAPWRQRIEACLPPSLRTIGLISLAVTGLVGGVKQLGSLEPLELKVYDQMMQLRSDEAIDPRLLIVTITEADIRIQKQSTLSDQTVADVLTRLEQYHPSVIGLDLYRDLPQPPGHAALQKQFHSSHLITITKLGDSDADSIPPPPGVPSEQVGFNDFPTDPDGVIRRSLLFGHRSASFSLRLASSYLKTQGITPTASSINPDDMQFGKVTFIPLSVDSGGYQTNDARGYQILLNYRSRHPIARQVSLEQVLQGQLSPEWVKDKIVLIGTTASSGKDLFYTPYSAGETTAHQMPGVEIHAQMVSQILSAVLNQRPLFWFLPESGEWLWIAAWAGLGGSLAWQVRHPLKLGLGCSAMLIGLGATSFLWFIQAGWVPVVAPAIAAILTMGTIITHRAQQAHRQQQMVMTLLGQNTSKEIADALWHNRDRLIASGKLPGQRLVATMLFTDIKSFSSISESIPAETLLDWLNEYLEAMIQEVQRYQGIINKFTGDGLLAVFGVPIPRLQPEAVDQDAYRAVACALAMGDRLCQLNQNWQQQGLPVVQMRVGIFTGSVVVGSLGGKDRLEYGVIGDSVNIASRLESCAKELQVVPCRILIAEETLEHVQNKFRVEPWGPMTLRGKQQMVEVYQVMGHATDS
jgi:adenylate cyclase